MIRGYLNSIELTFFPDTAIGLSIENFNISDMSNRKIDRTNVIQVPKAGNEAAFEFSSIPNAPTDFVYNDYDFDLIVDGVIVYKNGRAFIIGEDADSYTLNVTNAKNIIDLLKSINLADLYTGDTVTLINTTTWKNLFAQKTNGFKIDYLFGEVLPPVGAYKYSDSEPLQASQYSYLSIYISTILDKIEADFDISFSGALLSEADFVEMRMPCIIANLKRNNGSVDIYVDDLIIHNSLTAWDLIKNILQLFCGVFKVDGTDLELQKFNDLDITTPIDWTGKLVSSSKKYSIPDTAQKNYIKHQVAEDVDVLEKGGSIDCNNLNINFETDLISLKDKLFPYLNIHDNYANASTLPLFAIGLPKKEYAFPDLVADPTPTQVKGLSDFVIFIDSDEFLGQPINIGLEYYNESAPNNWVATTLSGTLTSDADTTIVDFYDPTGNYTLIETMLTDPVFYEAELLLNIVDINGFDHFKGVRIDELEGIFYVNKIIDFLATSPGTPTKVELIKIS